MAAQVPYTHDDWDWGLDIGIEQFQYATVNSRYAGNFFVIVMTRSEILKTLIMGMGYWLIPYLAAGCAISGIRENSKERKFSCYLLCNILLLTMDRRIWQQTYGWVAGYANFVISAIFLLIIVHKILCAFDIPVQDIKPQKHHVFIWLCISLASQLFLENIALLLFALSICALLTSYMTRKQVASSYIGMLFGSILGLLIIFGSDIYKELWASGSAVGGYRQVFFSSEMSLRTSLARCFEQAISIPYLLWENNLVLSNAILLLLCAALIFAREKNHKLRIVFLFTNLSIVLYYTANHLFGVPCRFAVKLLINCFFFLAPIAEVLFLFQKQRAQMMKMIIVWACAPAVIVPLIVTTELGPRLFFTSNIFLVVFAAMLCEQIISQLSQSLYRIGICSIIAITAILLSYHGIIYYDIGNTKEVRNNIMSQAIADNANHIHLPQYPHLEYLWLPNPTNAKRETFFKAFYGVDEDVTIVFEE